MLSDSILQLLTAYVDGELPIPQREAVQLLVEKSPEARDLLRQLESDAAALRALPRHRAGFDAAVRLPQSVVVPVASPTPSRPRWQNELVSWFAFTASGILAVATYHLAEITKRNEPLDDTPRAALVAAALKEAEVVGPEAIAAPMLVRDIAGPNLPATTPEEPSRTVASAPKAEVAIEKDTGFVGPPEPSAASADSIFAIPPRAQVDLKDVTIPRIALLLALRELDQETTRERLIEELQREPSHHIELACQDTGRAFDRVQAVLLQQGLRLILDDDAQDRLKLRLKTNLILYTDQLTVNEWARVLEALGKEDKQAETRKRGDGQFDRVLLDRMSVNDRRYLVRSLGVDPFTAPLPRPHSPSPFGVDIRKPLAEQTGDHVVKSLKGQGVPRPTTEAAIRLATDRPGLVLVYNTDRHRFASPSTASTFLDRRQPPRPGAVQLVLILKANGN